MASSLFLLCKRPRQPLLIVFLLLCCFCCSLWPIADCLLQVGAGIADVTGPVCQVNTMGYANAHLSGLHTRLYSRAFAFRDTGGRYAAYAVVDIAMISHLLKFVVGNRLAAETNGRYSEANLMLSATHTHAGPGGYNQDLFLVLNTPGFERKHFDYIADGVVQSILTADKKLAPARVMTNTGQLYNASINRHPHQYLLNPENERAHYADNIDREMFLLRFDNAASGRPIGSVAWFPVHGTSLNMSNRYVSGDNKGVASLLMEGQFGGGFVAAFPQAHSGDVTPNTRGAFSAKNGTKCDSPIVNTFDCRSRGPGANQYDSLMIVGRRQFEMALKLHQSATVSELVGVDPQLASVYDVRDVTSETFPAPWTVESAGAPQQRDRPLRVCPAAFGYGFCGGTVDGYGLFDYFTMGRRQSSVLINLIRDIMGPVLPADRDCHGTKQICMNAGRIMWSDIPFMSNTVPTQILRIGQLFIAALPAEITTMSGRRLIKHLAQTAGFPKNGKVQLNGLSNGYYFYITTEQEYNGTYYEAGATLYGPNTLAYYAWHLGRLVSDLLGRQPAGFNPLASPADLDKSQRLEAITGQPQTGYDFAGLAADFGDPLNATKPAYSPGDSVQLFFVSCNPRNSLGIRGHSFVLVERYSERLHRWLIASTDAGLDTRFRWYPLAFFQSVAMVTWSIPAGQQPGDYRIRHQGHCRPLLSGMLPGDVRPFSGVSGRFRVLPDGLWRPSRSPDDPGQVLLEEADHKKSSSLELSSSSLDGDDRAAAALTGGAVGVSTMRSVWLLAVSCLLLTSPITYL